MCCRVVAIRTKVTRFQVFVPKYGLESMIVLQQGKGTTVDIEELCVRHGDCVIKELGLSFFMQL